MLQILFFVQFNVSRYVSSWEHSYTIISNNMFFGTAELAGGDSRFNELTRAKESVIRLEVSVKLYGTLWDLGASSALDEKLAGEQTRRHLAGPSSKYEVQNKLRQVKDNDDRICWRNPRDVRLVIESNVRSLKSGLREAWKEVVKIESKLSSEYSSEVIKSLREKLSVQLLKYRSEKIEL